jgi:hypothetical protein
MEADMANKQVMLMNLSRHGLENATVRNVYLSVKQG